MAQRLALGVGALALLAGACGESVAPPSDAGSGMDARVADAGTRDGGAGIDAGTDAAIEAGAGPACGGSTEGSCAEGLTCLCCDLGGPQRRCLCTTECTDSSECSGDRPTCDVSAIGGGPAGLCRSDDFSCCWGCD